MAATAANALNISTAGIPIFDGTATFTATTTTQYNTLVGGTSNAIVNIATGTSGQVLTSAGNASNPSYQTLPFTQMPWTDETTSFSAVVGNGYFVTGTATITLPASPAQGNVIAIIMDATNVGTITGNTGQTIRVGNAVSAAAGTAASNKRGDALTLVYRSADTSWIAQNVVGTWTVT